MIGKRVVILVLVLLAMSLAIVSVASAAPGRRADLYTTMSGDREVAPGDPDGGGYASIHINVGQAMLCYELEVWDIDPATAAHIHAAKPGINGPVVVGFSAPSGGSSGECLYGLDKDLLRNIIRHPNQYYVNVHNATYPGGAIRDQLRIKP